MEYYNINTTQNVDIQFKLASVGDRMIATALDFIFLGIYAIGLSIFFVSHNITNGWIAVFFIPTMFYHLLCETFLQGQSLGKMIMKIKVVKMHGDELTFGAIFIRWIFRFIDIIISMGAVGIITVAINQKGQRLGDILAQTTVLKTNVKESIYNTAYVEVEEEYQPQFENATLLNDNDIRIIKEVLHVYNSNSKQSTLNAEDLLGKTQKAIENKIGSESNISSEQFLETIVKDYNYYHQYL